MLSDICNDDCLVELFIDLIENIKRSHQRTIFHGKWMFIFPYVNFCKPFFRIAFCYIFGHFSDGFFCIGNNWNIYMNISGNGSRINVDMDNLCIWSKFMKFTCDKMCIRDRDQE